jgi:hypothetical protein
MVLLPQESCYTASLAKIAGSEKAKGLFKAVVVNQSWEREKSKVMPVPLPILSPDSILMPALLIIKYSSTGPNGDEYQLV